METTNKRPLRGNIKPVNPFLLNMAFHIETSQLICSANQITGFYMKCKTRLKWVNYLTNFFRKFSRLWGLWGHLVYVLAQQVGKASNAIRKEKIFNHQINLIHNFLRNC